jgi:hypothetical protein
MPKFQVLILVIFLQFPVIAQIRNADFPIDSSDTLKSFFVRKNPPILYSAQINHQKASLCNKMWRGSLYIAGYNITMGTYLIIAPEYVSKWNKKEKLKFTSIKNQYRKSFTEAPVIDYDLWFINYIGHPYQGGFYYNTVRAQNASIWQSSLFCIGQSLIWEYGWEAGMEQPSVQDLITTPFLGIMVGELSHVATVKMSRNGFRWYEAAAVCLINPSYALNNGFKRRSSLKK